VHFDYFSIDYAEELSALSGGVLEQQAQFAAHCVLKILQLYAKKQQPSAKATAQASLSDPSPSGSAVFSRLENLDPGDLYTRPTKSKKRFTGSSVSTRIRLKSAKGDFLWSMEACAKQMCIAHTGTYVLFCKKSRSP
jgi:hypothetical protein